jgi:phenylacetate-CoA ligase
MFSSAAVETQPRMPHVGAEKTTRLQSVIDHAAATVPFYRGLQEEKGSALTFYDFPVLSKKRFIENLDEMMSELYADYAKGHDPRSVTNPKTLLYEFTSGSSGYPLRCYKTIQERTRLALSLHKKRTALYKEFSNDKMFGFIHNSDYESQSYADSLGNLSEENIAKVLTYLRDIVRPAVLHGNTMVFVYYSDFIARHKFDLGSWRIEFIESVSESMSHEQRQHIEEHFRTTVYNCYGCLECYNVAYDCIYRNLHLNENVVLEIIDPNTGEDLSDSGREGEVLLTSLVNRAQPFIRYKTGDLATLTRSDCACGQSSPVIELSGRRKIDYVKLLYTNNNPNLTICGYDIFATVMYRMVSGGHDYVSWYNVIQEELQLFKVLFIKKQNFSDTFYTLFKQYAEEELGMPIDLEFIEKDEAEVLLINRKNRVFRSLLQND